MSLTLNVLTFALSPPNSQLLTNHYEQNWKYYCLPSGWGSYGMASDEELLLTKKIFWGVFDSLSQRVRGSCLLSLLVGGRFMLSHQREMRTAFNEVFSALITQCVECG